MKRLPGSTLLMTRRFLRELFFNSMMDINPSKLLLLGDQSEILMMRICVRHVIIHRFLPSILIKYASALTLDMHTVNSIEYNWLDFDVLPILLRS